MTTQPRGPVSLVSSADFARKVTELRVAQVETEAVAAARIGVSLRQYKRWMASEDRPERIRQSSIQKVAAAYSVDTSWFVNGTSSAPPAVHRSASPGSLVLDALLRIEARLEALEKRRWWRPWQ